MATGENLRINPGRLWDSLMQMAQIGPGIAGGNNRQTLTDADSQGRHLFARWCADAGMTMGVDTMGNMFATRPGEEDLLPVYMGSHLDTQPTGGKYDGVLGVLGALEVVRSMNDMGIKTRHPIVVTNWTNEEGARFAPAMLASGVFAGLHTEDYAKSRRDPDGLAFGDELARIGWVGDEVVGARKIHAMFELHIEQGPILEAEGKTIGVVTHGQGLWWLEITLTGKDAHTGSTPMTMRVNAGLGMARITERVHQIAMSHQPNAVGAVGQVKVFPNSRNVIPGKVVFTVDIRSPEQTKLDLMKGEVIRAANAVAAELGLGISIEEVGHFDPVTFEPSLVRIVRQSAEKLGFSHMDIV
ncbi:MAG: Zn-dependent hydrolase, partial [Pseudorhodobacter sp.]|nr:Zn-dependent hydrolase [Pseudorhodobacter sp.]